MEQSACNLHLILGNEKFLVERTLENISKKIVNKTSCNYVPVKKLSSKEIDLFNFNELFSPSLFLEKCIFVIEITSTLKEDIVQTIISVATNLISDITLVIVLSENKYSKKLFNDFKKLNSIIHYCDKLSTTKKLSDFVRSEFRNLGSEISNSTIKAVLNLCGDNIRDLAMLCSQLAADSSSHLNDEILNYFSEIKTRSETNSFKIAEMAVNGDIANSIKHLRLALLSGISELHLADSLAEAVHNVARIKSLHKLESSFISNELHIPIWYVNRIKRQASRWSLSFILEALYVVITLSKEIRGISANNRYSLEQAVLQIGQLALGSTSN